MSDCLFCAIIAGDIPADIVYQNESTVAFRDIQAQAPTHVLVVPRRHIVSLLDVGDDDGDLMGELARVVGEVARREGVAESGFRSVANSGPDAQQSVPHLHIHVLGGRQMTWPPG